MPYCGARAWKIGNCCTGNSQHLKQLNLAKSLLWHSPWPWATGMAAAAMAFEIRSAKQRKKRVPNKSTNTGTAGSAWLAGTSGTSGTSGTYQSCSPSSESRVGYIFLTTLITAVDSSSRGPRRGALVMPGLGPDRPLKVAAPGPSLGLGERPNLSHIYLAVRPSSFASDSSKMKKSTHCREKSLHKSFGGTLFTRTCPCPSVCPLVRAPVQLSGSLLCT